MRVEEQLGALREVCRELGEDAVAAAAEVHPTLQAIRCVGCVGQGKEKEAAQPGRKGAQMPLYFCVKAKCDSCHMSLQSNA